MELHRAVCLFAVSLAILSGCSWCNVPESSNRSARVGDDCPQWPAPELRDNCSLCSTHWPKKVTLVVRNVLRRPKFENSVTLSCTFYKYLWDMLQEAARINTSFKFSATYFASWGFFIDKINGVAGDYARDQTFWEILDGSNRMTSVGVSSYVPQNGETVTFNFTRGSHPSR